jgi:hypothetical protein
MSGTKINDLNDDINLDCLKTMQIYNFVLLHIIIYHYHIYLSLSLKYMMF